MKILIIDDEYTIRHGIATIIRKYNERWTIVGEASDVSQALSIIRQERPDVIFLDIKMPGKSGIDLLREIQEIPLKTLSEKDMAILQMRMEGKTLEEIAKKLGYKNHSGVLKRIRKIGLAYEKFTGVDYGFENRKII